MRRRTWVSLAVVLAIIVALVVAIYLRRNAPPEVARLLPEADAVVYINVKPLHALARFSHNPIQHDADYQAFIDATGIVFERDLDRVAFAFQRMADPNGPNGPVAYSEVFQGRFNGQRLATYLAAQAAGKDRYAGHDIYSILHDGRTVRVAILGYNMVAVSNTPTAEQIHSIIDRYHASASPFSGNTLLSRYYSHVPLLSEVWGIGALGLPFTNGNKLGGFSLPLALPPNTTWIASLRYLGTIHLRLEEIAPTPEIAAESAGVVNLALSLLRSAETASNPQDPSVKDWNELLQSTTVQQKGNVAILRMSVPIHLVQRLLSEGKTGGPATPNERPANP